MKDLAPYICTFPDCSKSEEFFNSFDEWIDHMQEGHVQEEWLCVAPMHGPKPFASADLYIQHMRYIHDPSLSASEAQVLGQMDRVPASAIFSDCPFCNCIPADILKDHSDIRSGAAQELLQVRIADHLEMLSLISINHNWLDPSDEETLVSDGTSLKKRSTRNSHWSSQSIPVFSDTPNRDLSQRTVTESFNKVLEDKWLDIGYSRSWTDFSIFILESRGEPRKRGDPELI
jgi:hypothetical protein